MMSSLNGKAIVITRSLHQSEEFASLLKKAGAQTVMFPAIEIIPPESWKECDGAIGKIDKYDGIIFSSSNAVSFFFSRVNDAQREKLNAKSVYVVGEKTKSIAIAHGVNPIVPPAIHDGKHLAEKIISDGISGKRFLIPKGNLGRSTLKKELEANGAMVDEAVVYRTVAPFAADAEELKKRFTKHKIDVTTFFSPSSVENCTAVIPSDIISAAAVAVIGNVTAEAASDHGLVVAVIAEPSTTEGMVHSLEYYFEKL